MYPKWLVFLIWGVFEWANVSQMARILDLGSIFTSDCIPNVLFLKIWGVFEIRDIFHRLRISNCGAVFICI